MSSLSAPSGDVESFGSRTTLGYKFGVHPSVLSQRVEGALEKVPYLFGEHSKLHIIPKAFVIFVKV